MALDIEPVLLSGDDEAIDELAGDTDRCVVVDWREEDGDIVDYVAAVIPEAGLSHTWTQAGEGEELLLTYKGQTVPAGLPMSGRDRYITIRAINRLLAGDYEMRLFRITYESDTHSFYTWRGLA